MNGLPAGFAAPLPFPESSVDPLTAILLAMAGLAALLLLRRLTRRPAAPVRELEEPSIKKPRPDAGGIEAVIEAIRGRYGNADLRRGCHELSRVLRDHFEKATGHRFTTKTSGEIATAIGDGAVASFFDLLGDLQFGRKAPSHDDFAGICELAEAVSQSWPSKSDDL